MEDKERRQWLANLQPGDEVARQSYGGWSNYIHADFLKVDRVTAKYIVVGPTRYRKEDGDEAGNKYRGYRLNPPTAELKTTLAEQTRNRELLALVDKIRWRDVPNEILEAVVALVSKPDTSAARPEHA